MTTLSKYLCPPLTSLPLCLPRYYGGIILVGVGAFAVNMYFSKRVVQARKEHGVEYPIMYHPTNNQFNCIQRGHQNFLETLPLFLMLLCTGGLRYPRFFSVCGSLYLVGRLFYFRGYSTGDPAKRKQGAIAFVAIIPMVLGTLAFGVQHLMSSIKCQSCIRA